MTDNNVPLQNKDKINSNDDFESPPLASLNINGYECSECSNKCSKCSEQINRLRNEINKKEEEISVIKNKLDLHFFDMMTTFTHISEKDQIIVKEKDNKIQQLEKEKQDLIDRVKQLEQYHTEQTKQIEKLQYDNNNLVNNVIKLQKNNKELTIKYETINSIYITLNDEHVVLKREHSELKHEHSELKHEHSELSTKFDGLEKQIKDIRDSITSPLVTQQNAELSVYVYISDLSKIYLRYILMAKLREIDAIKYKDSEWITFSCEYADDALADQVSWDTYNIDLARIYDFNELRNETVHPTKPTKAAIRNTIDKINDREEELNQMELWNANITQEKKEELRNAYKYLTDNIIKACETYQPSTSSNNRSYKKF